MPFETLYTCRRISVTNDGVTLHDVSPVFPRGAPVIVFYARVSRIRFGEPTSYSVRVLRWIAGELAVVHEAEKRRLTRPNRLFSSPVLHAWTPNTGLEPGVYMATIVLSTGEQSEAEFLVD